MIIFRASGAAATGQVTKGWIEVVSAVNSGKCWSSNESRTVTIVISKIRCMVVIDRAYDRDTERVR